MIDLEPRSAQFVGETPHRCDHEMSALAVPPLRRELGGALDEQDTVGLRFGVVHRTDAAVELVAEHPHGPSGCGVPAHAPPASPIGGYVADRKGRYRSYSVMISVNSSRKKTAAPSSTESRRKNNQ